MAAAVQAVLIETVTELATIGICVVNGCSLTGLSRSVYYKITRGYLHYQPVTDPIPQRQRHQPAALSEQERAEVVEVLTSEEYETLSVDQAYWRVFDAGKVSCSSATFHRTARAERLTGERRKVRRGAHSAIPVAFASRPNQLWSWDATELCGGVDGQQRYQLMLVLDVYSRDPMAWSIEPSVTADAAKTMFAEAFGRLGVPDTVHADRGSAMRSNALTGLFAAFEISASFSRPRVSDDNPFSESMFKTLKYDQSCPDQFDNIDHARAWTATFLHTYAHEHCHSGIGHYHPAAVYDGTVNHDIAHRQAHLDAAYQAHPERFRHPPTAPTVKPTGINHRPKKTHHLSQPG